MSDVPSNLIPTRITQLPTAPVASEDSLLLIVYQGNNYQIRAGDLLSVAGVPVSRQVIAGTGLTGGGQLLNNVTLSVASKGINGPLLSDTGVSAGVYGSSTQVPVFTVDSTGRVTAASTAQLQVSGYVPETREVIAGTGLSGGGTLNNNVTIIANLSDATPESGFQSGVAGVSTAMSRSDHKHPAVDLSSDDEVDNILGLSNGGTAKSLVPDAGAIIWCGADGLYVGPPGLAGQVLVSGGNGEYTWGSALIQTDQAANLFYSGPASGGPAPTSFRNIVNADLPDSGVTANTYGSATAVPVVTVNDKGVITAITTEALVPGLVYKGAWNASTNTPTLVSSTGTSGWYYVVSVAGATNLDGITDWQVGDWAIFNGTTWQKIDQTNTVSSVNGQTGAVVLTAGNVGAQPADQQLSDIAAMTPTLNTFIVGDGSNFVSQSASTARTSLGLGTIATQNASAVAITGGSVDGTAIGNTTRSSVKATTIDATGKTTLPASTSGFTPFNIAVGATPATPSNGDIWVEPNGVFSHNAGFTNQLDFDTNMSGVLAMPTITITGGGATFDATSVDAFLFSTATFGGNFRKFTIPAATGLALADQTTTYLVVKYNGGSPVFDVTLNVADINGSDVAGAALLFRNGTEVHHQSVNWGLAPASRNNRRLIQTRRYERGMGLALGESTGRVITVSAGVIWYGVTEYAETAQTSSSSNAEFWYHVSGAWTKSNVSTYNNTQYDNGTNLVTLSGTGTQYAVNWVYRYLDGAGLPKLAYVVGTGNYNLAQAVASGSPTPPAILSQMAILVGRIIVAQNASTATQIDSAFTQVFSGTIVTDHNDLSNLQGGTTDEYYHLTAAQHTVATQAASASVNGYLTSTDWSTFNSKGSGSVTSVSGTGTVNGLTLTGTVTTTGNLTLGGALDLSSPPAIGGTAPAAITGTTITATAYVGINGGTF